MNLYQQALKYYRSQEWDLAEMQFLNLGKMSPARAIYPMYVERIAYFRQQPPGNEWDGVYTHTSK
jgi:adenylate cyclase